jgi:hypothetical protein
MQPEKARSSSCACCLGVAEEATLATPGEPPLAQPAASSANAATATAVLRMS